ncbi:MAG: N-acetylmuramoyl-L-alanine amidase [Planctomycetes bacterium]|nr:N-acetylmuramoyl-L-alanine amidase [Planctomycetota bacterium]
MDGVRNERQGGWRRGTGTGVVAALLALVGWSGAAWAGPKPPTSWVPAHSGNYTDSGPRGITRVVIHDIEGGAPGAIGWFQNAAASASAHYVIGYEGHITQMVADQDIAWHAGNWAYNTSSVGIEHAGFAGAGGFTEAEYAASAALTRWLCSTYGIPMDRAHIIGHNEVPDPDGSGFGGSGHHWDPGPHWNWAHYMALVTSGGGGGGVAPAPAPAPAPPPSSGVLKGMKVTTAALNVRTGPGTGNPIMGGVYSGQLYVSMTQSGVWHKIWFAGNTGWCHGSYLTRLTGVTARKVTAAGLNVRTGPSTGHAAVGLAHAGEMYLTNGNVWPWVKIFWGGTQRWFHAGYTTPQGL